jgi:uncharacterized membrane protein YfcA
VGWKELVLACATGMLSGLLGLGGGVFLIDVLVLFFGFSQHEAQGRSLVAPVPPSGLLAFMQYYRAGQVNVYVALLLIPGVFLGGMISGRLAELGPRRLLQRSFAIYLGILGVWQIYSAYKRWPL